MNHTPIVYTTVISNDIRRAFTNWRNAIKDCKPKQIKMALYIALSNICEKENKITSKIVEELSKFN